MDDPAELPAPERQELGPPHCDSWWIANMLARNSISCQQFLAMAPAEVQALNLHGWWQDGDELLRHQETYQPLLHQWQQQPVALQAQREQVQQQEKDWARHHEGLMAQLLPNSAALLYGPQ